MYCESGNMQPVCKEKFGTIEKRLNEKSHILDENVTDLNVLRNEIAHVTRSIGALTKALWAIAGSIVATLFGFFVWYIQNL